MKCIRSHIRDIFWQLRDWIWNRRAVLELNASWNSAINRILSFSLLKFLLSTLIICYYQIVTILCTGGFTILSIEQILIDKVIAFEQIHVLKLPVAGTSDVPVLLPEPDLHSVVGYLLFTTAVYGEQLGRMAISTAAHCMAGEPSLQPLHLRVLQRPYASDLRSMDRVRTVAALHIPKEATVRRNVVATIESLWTVRGQFRPEQPSTAKSGLWATVRVHDAREPPLRQQRRLAGIERRLRRRRTSQGGRLGSRTRVSIHRHGSRTANCWALGAVREEGQYLMDWKRERERSRRWCRWTRPR